MKREFLVERQGKTFALYAGILDLAHEQGLQGIFTSLVQIPDASNDNTAICKATVTLVKDGKLLTFEGYGDAAPNNVAAPMRNCLIRFAETRAKARALRDAVNIGVAAFEELGDEDEGQAQPAQATRSPQVTSPMRVENSSDAPCPECHAPAGKPHGTGCSQRVAA